MSEHTHANHPLANTYGCLACAEAFAKIYRLPILVLTEDEKLEEKP